MYCRKPPFRGNLNIICRQLFAMRPRMSTFLWSTLFVGSAAAPVTINNAKPRLDTNSNIIDAHSGNIVEMDGK